MITSKDLAQFMRGLYSPQDIETILSATVAISGAGGSIGGFLCDVLTRKGFNQFRLSDPDIFEQRNISRQHLATTQTLGQSKIEVIQNHIKNINPSANFQIFDAITLENIESFLSDAHVCCYQAEGFIPWLATIYACEKNQIPFVNVSRKERQRSMMKLRVMNYKEHPFCRVDQIDYLSFGLNAEISSKIRTQLKKGNFDHEIFLEAEAIHLKYKKKIRFETLHRDYPSAGDIRTEYPSDYVKRYTDPEITLTGAALAARAVTDIVMNKNIKVYEVDLFSTDR